MDEYIFKRPSNEYKINLYPVQEYFNQAATYISKKKEIDITAANKLVKTAIKKFPIKDPEVIYNYRNDDGDVDQKKETLSNYIKNALESNEVLVPSFTAYVHPSVKKSIHSDFLAINIAKRKSDKQNAFKYEQLGDKAKSIYYNTMQKVRKIFNNSLSGAYASKSTVLYNPSAHYTLTSITRSVASIGNAVSESIVAGNKQFKTPEVTLNYIVAIVSNMHKNSIEYAIRKYKLHTPTVSEVMDMLHYSSRYYWESKDVDNSIIELLNKLDGPELAAVMYTNDLWHMKKYNESFVKNMLTRISKKETVGSADYLDDLNNSAEGILNLTHHICMADIQGMHINYKELLSLIELENTFKLSDEHKLGLINNFRDYLIDKKHPIVYSGDKIDDKSFVKIYNEKTNPEKILRTLASTAKNVTRELGIYKILFRTFFTTDIMPTSISYIKDMMRDAIVLSDTDSTCGAYDKWTEWYYGAPKFSDEAVALAATVMTINTQAIDHNLKLFARNMNISTDKVELLKMKNEYFWPVFTAANVSKHYYADTMIQEGNVYTAPKLELKGVHLIASSVDQVVVDTIHNMISEINAKVSKGDKISINYYITKIANLERDLIQRIKSGDINIYKKDKIKEAGSYKLDKIKSPYINHMLWEDVFADKYGSPGEPTYMVIKVPTTLDSKRRVTEYLSTIEDSDIRDKLTNFLTKYKKEQLGTFRPPISIVGSSGIPEEIIAAIDVKRIVIDSLNAAYVVLDSIGAYRKPNRIFSEMGY